MNERYELHHDDLADLAEADEAAYIERLAREAGDVDRGKCTWCWEAFRANEPIATVAEVTGGDDLMGEGITVEYAEMHVGCGMKAAHVNRNVTLANAPF
jgi:hypothetical protein|tara:strand:- start:8284 stop:8580 length:297 start_codon:yes stop_codon:yes gene_type:complete